MNETSKLRYRTWREQERKREHSDGKKDKLREILNPNFIRNNSLVTLCHYTCG